MADPSLISIIFTGATNLANALAPWAAVVLALLAYLQGRKNNADLKKTDEAVAVNTLLTVAAAKETTEQSGKIVQIHALVNNMNTAGLGREALDREQIASLTGADSDRFRADSARDAFDSKVSADKRAQAGVDAAAEAASIVEAVIKADAVKRVE